MILTSINLMTTPSITSTLVSVPMRLLTAPLSFQRFTNQPGCPHCGSKRDSYRVSRPNLLKSVLFFVPLKSYRCLRCRKKHLRF
ncbi:transposase [Spirosoma oryzicola]|uniref:transposase n=1 Tax=Spirosoma oryzicola TaxID=2898794 RepID=UPI003CC517DD